MGKNQPHNVSKPDAKGKSASNAAGKRLKIKDVKGHFEELSRLPSDAMLPDLSHLTIGNRFAIALRFIAPQMREVLLSKSRKQIDRYEAADTNDESTPEIPV